MLGHAAYRNLGSASLTEGMDSFGEAVVDVVYFKVGTIFARLIINSVGVSSVLEMMWDFCRCQRNESRNARELELRL